MTLPSGWLLWALLSACFAALTAIFAKVGIRGVDSDFATLLRTVFILGVLAPFVWLTGKWTNPLPLSGKTLWTSRRSLRWRRVPRGSAACARWRSGTTSKVAPVTRFRLVQVALLAFAFLGERPVAREWLGIALVACGVLLAVRRQEPCRRRRRAARSPRII